MSSSSNESDDNDNGSASSDTGSNGEPGRIDDEQLPEDLQPTDDNPLAKPPQEGDDTGDSES